MPTVYTQGVLQPRHESAQFNVVAPSVLIADDSAVIQHTVRKALQHRFPHFSYAIASNGREAQQLIERDTFHLVLCDWEMPEMNGDELLTWLRRHPRYREIPFVMITSRTEPTWVNKAARLGVSNYLGKPFSTNRLVEMAAMELLKSGISSDVLNGGITAKGAAIQSLPGRSYSMTTGRKTQTGAKSTRQQSSVESPTRIPEHSADRCQEVFAATKQSLVKGLAVAQIRAGKQRLRCLIHSLATTAGRVVIPGGQSTPRLHEPAVFDIEIPDNVGSTQLNAVVVGLNWIEPREGTRLLCADLLFVDKDSRKQQQLLQLIHAICGAE